MKIVHISFIYGENNTGGAAIAATRMHKALLEHGEDSYFICTYKKEDGNNVYELPKFYITRKIRYFIRKVLRVVYGLLANQRSLETNSVPLFGLSDIIDQINPDLIHIHWINSGSLTFEQLSKIKYPVIINLHDMFMINALTAHVGKDMRYIEGFNNSNSSFWERWLFERKKKAIESINVDFIGPSQWICDCARKSIIGRMHKAYCVSNIISQNFKYFSEARNNHDKFIIAFGAYGGRKNKSKGFEDLEKSFNFLSNTIKDRMELWIFGEDAECTKTSNVKTKFWGIINNAKDMVEFYHSCDVFVFPSVQETQGMTKIEALLCGLPVIAFNRTACSEGIVHKENGWIAQNGDIESYAEGIKYYYDLFMLNKLTQIRENIAKNTKDIYSTDRIVNSLMKIYSLIKNNYNIQ